MCRASYPSPPTPLAASPWLVMVFQIAVTTGVIASFYRGPPPVQRSYVKAARTQLRPRADANLPLCEGRADRAWLGDATTLLVAASRIIRYSSQLRIARDERSSILDIPRIRANADGDEIILGISRFKARLRAVLHILD